MLTQHEACVMVMQACDEILNNNEVCAEATLASLGVDSLDALEIVCLLENNLESLGFNLERVDLFRALTSERKAINGSLSLDDIARQLRTLIDQGSHDRCKPGQNMGHDAVPVCPK